MLGIYRKTIWIMTGFFIVAIAASRIVPMFSSDPVVAMYAYVLPWLVAVVIALFVVGADEENRLTVGKVIIVTLVAMLLVSAVIGVTLYLLVPSFPALWVFRVGWIITIIGVIVESRLVNAENVAAAQQAAEERAEAKLTKRITAQREAQQEARRRAIERERRKRAKAAKRK
ncbi:hypothetical protein Uis1B_0128 [Bifidobacterium margollesii]|uniref:Uncharacterized protein n=1 Tax=Bifidobacterium margollesii TaxID=2020964 RepID=A0A2N5JCV1_9BIFI|nr:hypothetical protein [Bifidobacterium margollesii]PLS32036.1 hypothetical protein Uis1B_0128 [Bifidobacterium margollesii]